MEASPPTTDGQKPTMSPIPPPHTAQPAAKGWRFWAIFPPLSIATFLVGLDSTVISSALPLIALNLHTGDNYVWVINGYLLTSVLLTDVARTRTEPPSSPLGPAVPGPG
ncbi:hypothetical protein PG988_016022 [Apiospora saccharicola]